MLGPITVILEPLTVPTTAILGLLAALGKDRSQLLYALNSDAEYRPLSYRQSVVEACLNADEPIHYIAEFALETRLLTIRYLPHPSTGTRRFQNRITPATMNHVEGTSLTHLHFDVDFDNPAYDNDPSKTEPTYACVAARKADFVLDYLEFTEDANGRPTRVPLLQTLFGANPEQIWHQASGGFRRSGEALAMTSPALRTAPPTFRDGLDPLVIIDSVRPRIEDEAFAMEHGDPPNPGLPCVDMHLLGWDENDQPVYGPQSPYYVPGQVVVKAYSPEGGP